MRTTKTKAVYRILCKVTGDQYIGGSTFVEDRWSHHRCELRKGGGRNKNLQEAWDTHGEGNFLFEIIEKVGDNEDVRDAEQRHIDAADSEKLYNIAMNTRAFGTGFTRDKNPFFGKKHSESALRTMRDAKVGRNNPMYGCNGDKNPMVKLNKESVIEIRRLYATGRYTHANLSSRFGVCRQHIGQIVNRKTWDHV